ncbi:MAG: 4'-phosphopantetheinyl transferase superfamily protein [Gammaproteobacteria bacterium]|jgi:4'-phosphopantetheinyl transferase
MQARSGEWTFGPVRVWLRPHVPGERGEPQARVLLGQALAMAPEALPLTRDERGRPWFLPPLAHVGTGWSHSGTQLLVGLGERMRLGVDLERLRPRPRMREVAQRFFHPEETAWLAGLDDESHAGWFFRLWCAKEALLKAHGHGLSFGLHRLRFVERDGALVLDWCDPALGEAGRWHLQEWQATPEYRAALAWYPDVEG